MSSVSPQLGMSKDQSPQMGSKDIQSPPMTLRSIDTHSPQLTMRSIGCLSPKLTTRMLGARSPQPFRTVALKSSISVPSLQFQVQPQCQPATPTVHSQCQITPTVQSQCQTTVATLSSATPETAHTVASKKVPEGLVDQTKHKVDEVRSSMDHIIASFTSLADSHSELKTKLLVTRRKTLEKYFVGNGRWLFVSAFLEWKTVAHIEAQKKRYAVALDELDIQRQDHAKSRSEWENEFQQNVKEAHAMSRRSISEAEETSRKTAERLEHEIKTKGAICDQLEKENMELSTRWRNQQRILTSFSQLIQGVSAEECDADETAIGFATRQLHDVLHKIDPSYVPPIKQSLIKS